METTLQLEIVTPDKEILSQEVTDVVVPGSEGEFGVLPGHAPMISLIAPGVLQVGDEQKFLVDYGYAEIQPDRVTILVDQALLPSQVEVEKMREDLTKCHARLAELSEDHPDYRMFYDLREFFELCLKVVDKK